MTRSFDASHTDLSASGACLRIPLVKMEYPIHPSGGCSATAFRSHLHNVVVAQTLAPHNHKHPERRIRKLSADFREHLLRVLLLRLQFATTVYTLLTLQLFCDRIRSYRRKSLAYPLPQSLQQSQGILTILEVQVDFVGATATQPNYRRSILRLVSVHAHKSLCFERVSESCI